MIAAAFAVVATSSPALAAAQPLGSRTLHIGMRGPDVRTLQQDLSASGFATTVTGIFNTATLRHVVAFQRHYGLAPDGVVGRLTTAKLEAVTATKARLGASAASSETSKTGAASLGSGTSAVGASPESAPKSKTTTTTTAPKTTTSTTTTTSTATTTTASTSTTSSSGGAGMGSDPNDGPVEPATLEPDGLAVAPVDAPAAIVDLIAAANRIATLPYIYGGGHDLYHGNPVALDAGYDCSGSVSFALHGAGLLSEPFDSTQFETWGASGVGRWITLYTNAGHVYMHVAGLWFDTAAQSAANGEDRWSTTRISPADGFIVVHPLGW